VIGEGISAALKEEEKASGFSVDGGLWWLATMINGFAIFGGGLCVCVFVRLL
jgi:hypothetical protein